MHFDENRNAEDVGSFVEDGTELEEFTGYVDEDSGADVYEGEDAEATIFDGEDAEVQDERLPMPEVHGHFNEEAHQHEVRRFGNEERRGHRHFFRLMLFSHFKFTGVRVGSK